MSLKDVQVAVERFLESDKPSAIAISGQWGSGKTYFWDEVIKDASAKKLVKKYSYVSLFGTGNLADLKSAIFDNSVAAEDIAGGATSSTWVQNATDALRAVDDYELQEAKGPARRLFRSFWKLVSPVLPPLSAWGGVARSLSFMAIKDYVVCLDDVERKAAGFPLKDVLGLVSMLKEKRGCRVVVILNDDELGDDRAVLKEFREKVFDGEIVFSPSTEECAKLVFTEEWPHSEDAKDKVLSLGIKNVRILQRIRRVIETLLPYLEGKDKALIRQLIHSSVILTWSYNSRGKNVPPYELITSDGFSVWGLTAAGRNEEETEEDKVIKKIVYDYGYRGSDEFDHQIISFIEHGFVVEKDFIEVVESFQEKALKNNHDGSFTQAWSLFHDTFASNDEELVETMRKRFMEGAEWISLGNAMGTVKLMRELDRNEVADELMTYWIEIAKKKNKELLDLRHAHLFEGSVDEKFKDAVKNAYASDKTLPSLRDTVIDISGKNGWGMDQIEVLSQASVDDYYEFFKSIDGDRRLSSYVENCLQFRDFQGDDRYAKIHANASGALRRIASESHLNAVRVSRFLPKLPEEGAQ